MENQTELTAQLSLIQRGLQASEIDPEALIEELVTISRSLKVPVDDRRDDAHVFIEGTEAIDTATWTQCGGLLFALDHNEVLDARHVATLIARRILDLVTQHQ